MADDRSGIATALAMLDASEPLADDQSDMFEAAADLPISARASGNAKGGRPVGARNKSTEAWREYLLSRYRSPLVALLEMCNRTPTELATDLGLKCEVFVGSGEFRTRREVLDVVKAAEMQMDAHKAVLPYLHQKAPTAIELPDDVDAPLLVIGHIDVGAGAASGLQLPLAKSEQNQDVIDVTPEKSDDQKSDES